MKPGFMNLALVAILLAGIGCLESQVSAPGRDQGQHGAPAPATGTALAPPAAIRAEHEHLHHQLQAAIDAGGQTGARARAVADVLLPHFDAEDAYAMPPLDLLEPLARGEPVLRDGAPTPQVRAAIDMAAKLRAHYDEMLAEHRAIVAALDGLIAAARAENKPEHAHFAEALKLHAQNEEQVLYPATLILGDYLRQRVAAEQAAGGKDSARP